MKKILTCTVCGKMFISEDMATTCPTCLSNSVKNDDPMDVAPINIMKMVSAFEKLTKEHNIANSLRELDFVCNQAYLRGYISEEFYQDVCEEVGLLPKYEEEVHLSKEDGYDYSMSARAGFYFDMFDDGEE